MGAPGVRELCWCFVSLCFLFRGEKSIFLPCLPLLPLAVTFTDVSTLFCVSSRFPSSSIVLPHCSAHLPQAIALILPTVLCFHFLRHGPPLLSLLASALACSSDLLPNSSPTSTTAFWTCYLCGFFLPQTQQKTEPGPDGLWVSCWFSNSVLRSQHLRASQYSLFLFSTSLNLFNDTTNLPTMECVSSSAHIRMHPCTYRHKNDRAKGLNWLTYLPRKKQRKAYVLLLLRWQCHLHIKSKACWYASELMFF